MHFLERVRGRNHAALARITSACTGTKFSRCSDEKRSPTATSMTCLWCRDGCGSIHEHPRGPTHVESVGVKNGSRSERIGPPSTTSGIRWYAIAGAATAKSHCGSQWLAVNRSADEDAPLGVENAHMDLQEEPFTSTFGDRTAAGHSVPSSWVLLNPDPGGT